MVDNINGGDARATQVYVAMQNLGKTVEEIETWVDGLEKVLVSVLIPESNIKRQDTKSDEKPDYKVPLAERLADYNDRLQVLIDKLRSTSNRIEL